MKRKAFKVAKFVLMTKPFSFADYKFDDSSSSDFEVDAQPKQSTPTNNKPHAKVMTDRELLIDEQNKAFEQSLKCDREKVGK